MKLKESGGRGGGSNILSLLGELGGADGDTHQPGPKNQTAADLFLKSHNEEQFSQT